LISTEAFCTFPVVGRTGGALAVRSHFFEFLALDQVFLAHQLVAGEVYEVIVTTSGGLYRYRTGDRVRVVGHIRQCPMLVFEGRLGVVDHFGEKLSLSEVARALSGLSAMLAFEAEPAGYALFGESITLHDSERVESHLLDNFHYRYCRQLGQLAPLRAYRLDPGSLVPFYARLDALGLRAGDAKPLPLRHESNWSRWLPGRWLHSQAGSGAPLE
jgi:hypothetical protein